MRFVLAAILVLAVCVSPAGAAPSGLEALWQKANGHYKQALYATNQGNAARAEDESRQALAAWTELERRFGGHPTAPYDRAKGWKAFVTAVASDLRRGAALAKEGKTEEAHAALEPARYRWADLREGLGLDLLGDRLTRYHDPMESVVLLAKGRTAATLTEEERAKLKAALPAVKAAWAKVEGGRMPELPEPARTQLAAAVAAGKRSVQTLDAALAGGDAATILKAAAGLKPPFMKLFLGFA